MRQYSSGLDRRTSGCSAVRSGGRVACGRWTALPNPRDRMRPKWGKIRSPKRGRLVARNWLMGQAGPGERVPGEAVMNMRTRSKRARFSPVVLALAVLLLSGGLGAAARAAEETGDDPESGSTYGRVRYLEGSLTLQRTGDGDLADATVNDPVAPGDRL